MLKEIPALPIITVAEDTKIIAVLGKSNPVPAANAVAAKEDWMRWNDYGIGLLLQNDFKGAEAAFTKTTEADPANADGWVNMAASERKKAIPRARSQFWIKRFRFKPDLARANYFYARDLKEEGRYDEAIAKLQSVLKQYPRDRVVRNELGRIYFLQKRLF